MNKTTHSIKSNIVAVFDMIGGREAMAEWAKENQTEFYRLYARGMPHEVTGEGGGPLQITISREDASVL